LTGERGWFIIQQMPNGVEVGFNVEAETAAADEPLAESQPFRIALFADFSGRANRGLAGGAKAAPPLALDRDNFDAVLKRCAPSLDLPIAGSASSVRITFTSLDDFHPEALSRFVTVPGAPTGTAPEPTAGGLLDRMVDAAEPTVSLQPTASVGDLQEFLGAITAGQTVPKRDAGQREELARTQAYVAGQLRALLHHPDFQALEAAWRSAFFLVRRLETGADLQLFLFDVSKRELYDDLQAATDLRRTEFFRYVSGNSGGGPWAVLGADYFFSATPEDVNLLSRIALIAGQQRIPFLAGAEPAVWGADSLEGMPDPHEWRLDPTAAQYWKTLRRLPEAAFVGLAAPRFLLRLPYGRETFPVKEFPFEEMLGEPVHKEYLWGNAAILCLCLLGQTFARDGWKMRPGAVREISRLPLCVWLRDGAPWAQPCAEALLTDRAAETILRHGVMPVLAERDGDRILLSRFQSLADPPQPLVGRW
jgi:type VI secretion system protein ImpC